MSRVSHFEIHALDPERTSKFYSEVFGWKITRWEGPLEYWVVSTGEGVGIDGGIVRRRGDRPIIGAATNAYVCTITLDSIDEALSRVQENEGLIVVEASEIPGIGRLAYATDPEGNIFGMLQPS